MRAHAGKQLCPGVQQGVMYEVCSWVVANVLSKGICVWFVAITLACGLWLRMMTALYTVACSCIVLGVVAC